MNERIRELFVEADFPKVDIEREAERFAELVVRECADICDEFQARDVGMQPAECAGAIRRRFGVEE